MLKHRKRWDISLAGWRNKPLAFLHCPTVAENANDVLCLGREDSVLQLKGLYEENLANKTQAYYGGEIWLKLQNKQTSARNIVLSVIHVITRVFLFCASRTKSLFICKVWMSAFWVLIMNRIYIINSYSTLRKCRYKMVCNSTVWMSPEHLLPHLIELLLFAYYDC